MKTGSIGLGKIPKTNNEFQPQRTHKGVRGRAGYGPDTVGRRKEEV